MLCYCITKERGEKKEEIPPIEPKYERRVSNCSHVMTWICTSRFHLKVTRWKIMHCGPVNSLLHYWPSGTLKTESLLSHRKISRVHLFCPLKKPLSTSSHKKQRCAIGVGITPSTEMTPEEHVISWNTPAPFWVPLVFYFFHFYLCQFSQIQHTLIWYPRQVHLSIKLSVLILCRHQRWNT